ncbi:tRNA modification GTPase trmE [Caloramator quimbayensis]|uniref:tRNA modification GTPase MnmE n=1 Tax=Caloramator quimbayensis TaxID=1147123 RepID=A0A1T4Y6V6_9CLOT|nr:tRNA uridine-5-carboxymethylaminomethyl(34) synthesis GTPase MnmE [Caloramator quimbayensis]SKA97456.1 tRNA modification GTPase trmE [Caloramator quimbayensis]
MIVEDTIAAISTSLGDGGIGIVRISGSKALEILNQIFVSPKGKNVLDMKSYTMLYGYIKDKKNDEIVDEVIVSYMKAPNTYTKEDIVEINCHGGMVAVRKILTLVIKSGARLAEPGEFTKRAFLNGRIDLSQAEAVIDIIRAKTDESMRLAMEQIQGKLSKKIRSVIDKLLNILAHIEATIDYPEDDIESIITRQLIRNADEIIKDIDELIKNADAGKIIREGLNTVIAGKPNVGKSSLLNMLIQENKAIVTEIPGTTRDVIEEYINIEGIPIRLVDTAGIRETGDVVEKIGVEKTKEYVDKADLVIFMLDASKNLEEEDYIIIDLIKNKNKIVVVNKMDIPQKIDIDYIKDIFKNTPIIYTSVKEDDGIENIKKNIVEIVYKGNISSKDVYITNIRHKDILENAKRSIENGIETLKSGLPLDCASIDFKDAYLKLGEITGDTVSDDIIDRIFSNFCIGK